jgi:hypothetical protein
MTGSSVAPLLVPLVGTICLVAWLILVFRADRQPSGPDR